MLDLLLRAPPDAEPCETVAQWWPRYREICRSQGEPLSRAIAGGFAADRVAWAFASGYQAALHALFPGAPDDRICALCVTEAEGNSPKAIKSSIRRQGEGWRLNGVKRWTTLGPEGALFFVAARDEAASGERVALKVIKVLSELRGVNIETMPPTKFAPEIPHAQLRFENVTVATDAMLPGDGYADYVKPFRTIEDLHINVAILAYLLREAQRLSWPQGWIERGAALIASMERLSEMSPSSPTTHVALAGALALGTGLIGEAEAFWEAAASDPASGRWRRDRELLGVASAARAMRTTRAWEQLFRPAG